MADSGDSASGWPGLLGQVNKTFDLIRDIFGYALPGAVFLAVGLVNKSYSLREVQGLLTPYALPPWAAFLAVLAACYAAGSVMAATVYMPISLLKYVVWMVDRHLPPAGPRERNEKKVDVTNITAQRLSQGWNIIYPHETVRLTAAEACEFPPDSVLIDPAEGSWRDWLVNNPTEVTSTTLQIRLRNRDLLNTLDRRETLNVMSGSMAAALLTGYYIFCRWHWSFSEVIHVGAWVTLVQFLTGLSHLRRVLKAVRTVKLSDPPPNPNFGKLLGDIMEAVAAVLKKDASA